MDSQTLQTLLNTAIRAATEHSRQEFQTHIDELTNRLTRIETPTQVIQYEPVTINPNVLCDESLDLVKTMPDFRGDPTRYVSWRQAAHTAYKVFEGYQGSSKHYQAVGIIRNKVVGTADSVLSSFNTVLNFKAIIAWLDFAYADKRPIHLIEQELSTLRQGELSVIAFYDEVERKLTLIINKTIMTHGGNTTLIESLNNKYREDALRIFISGLNRPLCDILFSSRPNDLPSALALAQELESNQARSMFAQTFNRQTIQSPSQFPYLPQYRTIRPDQQRWPQGQRVVPMDVDPSLSRFRQNRPQPIKGNSGRFHQGAYPRAPHPNIANSSGLPNRNTIQTFGKQEPASLGRERPEKRPNGSGQQALHKVQRINNLTQEQDDSEEEYWNNASYDNYYHSDGYAECNQVVYQEEINNDVNFLGQNPSCPISSGQSGEEV